GDGGEVGEDGGAQASEEGATAVYLLLTALARSCRRDVATPHARSGLRRGAGRVRGARVPYLYRRARGAGALSVGAARCPGPRSRGDDRVLREVWPPAADRRRAR